ncbi:MAG: GIY-YIG nuclease family protein [Patescibacteria group bacterium]|jgi:putative endonuclease
MWFTYILLSSKDSRTYTGSTDNLSKRLLEHNNGYVISTKNRRPLKYIYTESFASEIEARKREKYLKSGAGRKFIKTKIFDKTGN